MMETAVPELHDAILLCVGVAAVYLVVTMLQLMRLRRHRLVPIVAREPAVRSQLPLDVDVSFTGAPSFLHQLRRTSIEAGLKRLDLEVVRLRMELQETRDEVKRLRSERGGAGVKSVQNPTVNECHEQQYDRYRAAA